MFSDFFKLSNCPKYVLPLLTFYVAVVQNCRCQSQQLIKYK